MFRQAFYSLLVTFALVSCISANAGFMTPTPRLACSPTDHNGCGNTQACVLSQPVEANRVAIDITKDSNFVIYQYKPWTVANNNSNTYTIQLFVNGKGHTLKTIDEDSVLKTVGSFNFSIPPLSDTVKTGLDFTNPIKAYYQMIFDARNGGGDVYYSCSDVFITNKKVNITTTTAAATTGVVATANSTASATTGSSNSTATATTGLTTGTNHTTSTVKPITGATTATTGLTTGPATTDVSESHDSSSASSVVFSGQVIISMIAALYILF
ncbi:hypothetical protein PPL_04999 [Heterostelium album PN500]|uniref:Secreted protein n=1 Tax=Heterostelium pallidum (strain ATCC 26659 / Pp 5 / PN500) TaxID=670386 RepID=D3B955_HETP5|nr:hypothetical protein PPL_04999 [Heterostelium album PN500]EFA82094.1 hypothetical protein PPL_04999 [Heterostelium album PN500]|eukprot:XP_020434211.1 hypothetical protein PPL_04999 [Heterostelium album PN500]